MASSREREARKSQAAKDQSGEQAETFAEFLDVRPHEATGNSSGADPNNRESYAHVAFRPRVPVFGVQDEDGGQSIMSEIEECGHDCKSGKLRMRGQQREGSKRVRHVPCGLGAAFGRKRFGQNKKSVKRVSQTQTGGDPEGQPQIVCAQQSTYGWTDDESKTERGA